MMFTFCTLAIGQKYLDTATRLFSEMKKHIGRHADFVIVTDIEQEGAVVINDKDYQFYIKKVFNYNLKHLAIKHSLEKSGDYIIFIDADWEVYNDISKEKFFRFKILLDQYKHDFYFERPHLVGGAKYEKNIFWKEKIEHYPEIMEGKYDAAHVCNEQFMGFKRTPKLNVFVDQWEKRYQKCVEKQYNPFGEGLEIGMSVIDAGMSFSIEKSFSALSSLRNCFLFYNSSGDKYVRF